MKAQQTKFVLTAAAYQTAEDSTGKKSKLQEGEGLLITTHKFLEKLPT